LSGRSEQDVENAEKAHLHLHKGIAAKNAQMMFQRNALQAESII
jgi:hypothetical protein